MKKVYPFFWLQFQVHFRYYFLFIKNEILCDFAEEKEYFGAKSVTEKPYGYILDT